MYMHPPMANARAVQCIVLVSSVYEEKGIIRNDSYPLHEACQILRISEIEYKYIWRNLTPVFCS